jgi:transcriptional regulator with XRE-family HTH domain
MASQSPGKWLKQQREAQGVSPQALAGLLGLPEELVLRWESETGTVPIEVVPMLAEFFGLSVDQVWETTHSNEPRPDFDASQPATHTEFDPGGHSLDNLFESASGPTYASDLLDDEVDAQWLPVYNLGLGQPLAWTGGLPDGESETVESAPGELGDAQAFYVRAHDRRMSPTVEPGELVLVEPGRRLESGKLCFVHFTDGPADHGPDAIGRFQANPDGSLTLQYDNGAFQSIAIQPGTVTLFPVTRVIKQVS